MSDPWMDVAARAPAWKIRMLAQIHDLAAERSALRRRGYEHYRGTEVTALTRWHTELARLAELRTDLEARAAAV